MYKSDNENDISKDNTTHSRDSGNGIKTEHILEKIEETEEPESRQSSAVRSRPATNKAPSQRSQATFRSSSFKQKDDIENEDQDDDTDDENQNNQVLITELGESVYDGSSDEYDDDHDIEIPKPRKILDPDILYTGDIENEKDYETDLEDDEEKDEQANTPKDIYIKMCQNLKVIPCRYFMAHIENKRLVMSYHQFSNDEIRAISKPLWHNFNIEKLYLDGNWIEFNGAKYLSRMVRQNDFITELSLADNRLGETTQGTQEVCRMVSENCILKKLNLSGNCFSDRDVEILTIALEKNRLLKELDLSHNNFGEESGKFLGQFISSNDTLEILDISWNNFRGKAAKEIALGIKENIRLKSCNVSFNGFDKDGGKILADVIKNNATLENFNISNSRLTAECAAAIANAFEQNESLKSLNMSNNPITTSGALAIIYSVKLNNSSILEKLELSEIPVTKDFENVLKEIQDMRPDFKCLRGPTISTSNTKSILYEGGTKIDFEKILSNLKNK